MRPSEVQSRPAALSNRPSSAAAGPFVGLIDSAQRSRSPTREEVALELCIPRPAKSESTKQRPLADCPALLISDFVLDRAILAPLALYGAAHSLDGGVFFGGLQRPCDPRVEETGRPSRSRLDDVCSTGCGKFSALSNSALNHRSSRKPGVLDCRRIGKVSE